MISFWERSSMVDYDIIIIGAGIVGLNTAIHLREQYPDKRIAVFERGLLPTGASTKNAGFACFGSLSELVSDARHSNEQAIYELFRRRKNGIQLLRNRLGDEAIGYEQRGSHELLKATEAYVLDHLDQYNNMLQDLDEKPIFSAASGIIQTYGFDTGYFKYVIAANTEGSIHTGKMMQQLLQLALASRIEIKTGAVVTHFESNPNGNVIYLQDALSSQPLRFQCHKLAFCTNAFSKTFFPEMDITPGRGQVLITKPIKDLKPRGIFHFDEGYYYFRVIENRILFGGGRNMDFDTEQTTEIKLNTFIQQQLIQHLKEVIIPGHAFEIDMQWAGIMAFGNDKSPILHQHGQHVFGAFRSGGMGVALGSQLAWDLAEMIIKSE